MPDYTLYQGDCLQVMPTLEKGSVAMVFADLPYGITKARWDKCLDLKLFWKGVKICSSHISLAIASATQPFATDLIVSNRKAFRYDLIYQKSMATGFLNANRMPLRAHESLCVFYNKMPTYNAQKRPGVSWVRALGRSSNQKYGGPVTDTYRQESDGFRHPRSIISVKNGNASSTHPTQKPVALLEWLIATYTNPGDLVLDPVFGSNTTGVACARLGRRYIGIEKDPTYFAAGKARLEAEHARLAEQPAQGALAI